MISRSRRTQFSSMICNSDVVHKRWRFQCQRWKLVPVMICRSTGTLFSSMIYDSDIVHARWRFQRHSGSGFWGWCRSLQVLSFRQWFMILTSSMGAEDFSGTLDLGSGDDFGVSRYLVFVNDLWFWRCPWAL